MDILKGYVIAALGSILGGIGRALNLSASDVNQLMSDAIGVIYGPFGDAAALGLAPGAYLYNLIQNLDISVPQWITDAANFLINTVKPTWNWIINNINTFQTFMTNIANPITNIANALISAAFAVWINYLNWLAWVKDNGQRTITAFLNDPVGYIGGLAINTIKAALPGIYALVSFWNAVMVGALSFLSAFLPNPITWVSNLFTGFLFAMIPALKAVNEFITWWQQVGMPFLVKLVNDPEGVILDLIEKNFIDWLLDQIRKNW